MTGRERIYAALAEGTDDVAAVVCYPGILMRDHYAALTGEPWWHYYDPDPVVQARVLTDIYEHAGFDWFGTGPGLSDAELAKVKIVAEGGNAYRLNVETGERTPLEPPVVSGTLSVKTEDYPVFDNPAAFLEERVKYVAPFAGLEPGQDTLPKLLNASLGRTKFGYYSVGAPMWSISAIMGYEQFFAWLPDAEDTIFAAAKRRLANSIQSLKAAAAAGCDGVWIEDCMMDMIGPTRFAKLNLPLLQELAQAIRDLGMQSVYYYCGDPWPVIDYLTQTGADALSLEEGKKGFDIDIHEVVKHTRGQSTVLGNLDAIGVLEQGATDDLRREIARQLDAGRRNNGRFIMSTGSPVTPGTSIARLHEYIELVHELSATTR